MYKTFLCLLALFLILGCSKSGKESQYLVQNQTNGSEVVEIKFHPPGDPSKFLDLQLFAAATKELKPGKCIMLTRLQLEGIAIQAGKGGASDSIKRLCGESPASFSLDLDDQDNKTCKVSDYVIVDKGVVFDDYRLRNMTEENREELLKSNSCTPFEEWSKSGFTTN